MAVNSEGGVDGIKDITSTVDEYFNKLFEEIDNIILTEVEKYYNLVMDQTLPILGAILFCWIIWQAYFVWYRNNAANIQPTGQPLLLSPAK